MLSLDTTPEGKKAAFDLVLKSYEHHKNHARFEETQRSWFIAAYLTFTGLILGGILGSFFKNGQFLSGNEQIISLLLAIDLVLGIFIAFAITKVSGEFKRHNDRAEQIIKYVASVCDDKNLKNLLSISTLHPATHELGFRASIGLRSVAAMHNYIMSLFIALNLTLILWINKIIQATDRIMLCIVVAFFVAALSQHLHYRLVEKQVSPTPSPN